MIYSMTGFGGSEVVGDGFRIAVELRSVNSRFLEVGVRVPRVLGRYEEEIKTAIGRALRRGHISCSIAIEGGSDSELPLGVNRTYLKAYHGLLEEIREAVGLEEPVRLEHLLTQPELILSDVADGSGERYYALAEEGLEEALSALRAQRAAEGERLKEDLEGRLNEISRRLSVIEKESEGISVERYGRLRDRLSQLLGGQELEEGRLYQEAALLAEKSDITEECVRFRSHCEQFRRYLELDEPVGKRLGFLLQEMQREASTMAAKAGKAEITHEAVEIKSVLERLREQAQNIE